VSRIRWTLAVVATVVPRLAAAQGAITGRITSEGNLPLADARIFVVSTAASTTTG